MIRIEPASADSGILSAADVTCQAVADDQRLFRIKVRNFGKAVVKIRLFGFMVSRGFRNKNFLEIMYEANPKSIGGTMPADEFYYIR